MTVGSDSELSATMVQTQHILFTTLLLAGLGYRPIFMLESCYFHTIRYI